MSNYTKIMLGIQGAFWSVLLGLLIYLIIRRKRISQREEFEKRDN